MNYSESLAYLNSFTNFEASLWRLNRHSWNLQRMEILLDWFNHPEKRFFPILIAGTKGKGSTGFFLESMLESSGISSGFYSSPHLQSPRERIRLGGRMISENKWSEYLSRIKALIEKRKLSKRFGKFTYFEIMTLMAILVFAEAKVKVGIFEIGMGGRLDATNVLQAPLCIFTRIDYDHEKFLGETLSQIAEEKAAIIKKNNVVVVSPQNPEAMKVIRTKARRTRSTIKLTSPVQGVKIGLLGNAQKTNAGSAKAAVQALKENFGFKFSMEAALEGLEKANWPGRFEIIRKNGICFILDGAHNPASIQELVKTLAQHYPKAQRILVFGTSSDKKSARMLGSLSGYFSDIILTQARHLRSKPASELLMEAQKHFRKIVPTGNVCQAFEIAQSLAKKETVVVMTGSFYVIGEARTCLKSV